MGGVGRIVWRAGEGDGAYSFLPTLVDNTLTTLKDASHVSARVPATDMTTI